MTRSGYDDEIAYWARELALEGDHREYTAKRLTPEGRAAEHPAWIDGLIDAVRREAVRRDAVGADGRPRALDLGCGPLGTLGHAHEAGRLDVTGVDPLAEPYTELRERFGIDYPEPLVASTGERLSDVVAAGSVDLIYSRNSMDHAEDVQRCFDEAALALRDGGVFALEVFAYEGFREAYDGLHRFDFQVHDGSFACTDRGGASALDLASSPLRLVTLTPTETPKPAGVGADTTTVRAVFVKSDDPARLAEVAAVAWRDEDRARVEQFLDPSAPYLERVRRGWDAELLRGMYPQWADTILGEVPHGTEPAIALEVEARSMPTLAWASLAGHATVHAVDAQADAFRAIFERRELPPHPVDLRTSTARAALDACPPGGVHVVHLRDALERDLDTSGLLHAAARALAPGGVLLAEGTARRAGPDAWRQPFGGTVFVDGLEDGGAPSSGATLVVDAIGRERATLRVDPAAFGLRPVFLAEVAASDPLRAAGLVYRAAFVRV